MVEEEKKAVQENSVECQQAEIQKFNNHCDQMLQNDASHLKEDDDIVDKVDEEMEAQGEENKDENDTVVFDELKESLLTRKTSQRSESAEVSQIMQPPGIDECKVFDSGSLQRASD